MPVRRNGVLTKMFNEQGGVCPYCKEEMVLDLNKENTATIEHILPRSKGGPDIKANFMAVCSQCNGDRGNMPLGLFLLTKSNERRIA